MENFEKNFEIKTLQKNGKLFTVVKIENPNKTIVRKLNKRFGLGGYLKDELIHFPGDQKYRIESEINDFI